MAGVLTHDLSKILKDKDRGKDVASAPWYDVFNGERRNDHHATLAERRDPAREAPSSPGTGWRRRRRLCPLVTTPRAAREAAAGKWVEAAT